MVLMALPKQRYRLIKFLVFSIAAIPAVILVFDTFNNDLGANPLETLHHRTGDWALRFLLITLSMTSIKLATRWNGPLRFRRMFGLYCFFYATLHVLIYVGLEQSMSLTLIIEEIPKSPYIVVGLIGYLMLVPLAITSNTKLMKTLGKNWKKLHRSIYIIVILIIIHFFWSVKADYREPIIYALIAISLLATRLIFRRSRTNEEIVLSQTPSNSLSR